MTTALLLQQFITIWDERFSAYQQQHYPRWKAILRDVIGGLVVALVAIPLSVGFAVASNMRPEQGIVAGILAAVIGALFGGSKYQVYGPTAALISVISSIVLQFDVPFLILATVIAGVLIVLSGILRLGRFFEYVPHSVIVGFTMGIAATIVITQLPEAFGIHGVAQSHLTIDRLQALPGFFVDANGHALVLAIITFFIIRKLSQISVFIPGPLIAIVAGSFIANNIWHENFVPLLSTKYGEMGGHLFNLALPGLGEHQWYELIVPVVSLYFIITLESLLSAKMADRLADNQQPFNADKELFGQGVANIITPLLNGLPTTGALARTATSIKVGAMSPLACLLNGTFMLLLTLFFAPFLSSLPMACMGGLLVYVAMNMVKKEELRHVYQTGWFHTIIMMFTAIMTICTDLMIAVISATALFYVLKPFCLKAPRLLQPQD